MINSLVPGVHKRPYLLKQAYLFQVHVCLSMYDRLVDNKQD